MLITRSQVENFSREEIIEELLKTSDTSNQLKNWLTD